MSAFGFTLEGHDGAARAGTLTLPHGTVRTPAFMPVGTHGTVRGLHPDEVRAAGAEIILGNTYHLHLRPGEDVIAGLGGLQRFSGWNGPMLTDSGGFQVFSLETPGAKLNYGVNKVRFPNPVKVGAKIRATAKVNAVTAMSAGHQLTMGFTIEIEGEDKPACVAETVVLLLA